MRITFDDVLNNCFHVSNTALVTDTNHQVNPAMSMTGVVNNIVRNNFTVRDNHFFIIGS
ncbi:hypothetical protein D3C85_1677450 [compost metagenome]